MNALVQPFNLRLWSERLFIFHIMALKLGHFFCSRLAQVKRFRITSSRRPHTCRRQMLPLLSSASALPEDFHPGSSAGTAAQPRPLRAAMPRHIPKKSWSRCWTGTCIRIPGWENGGVCMICLETNTGKCCASAPLQWRSDPNPLCYRTMSFPIKLHGWKARIKWLETEEWGCLCLQRWQRSFVAHTGVCGSVCDAGAESSACLLQFPPLLF